MPKIERNQKQFKKLEAMRGSDAKISERYDLQEFGASLRETRITAVLGCLIGLEP